MRKQIHLEDIVQSAIDSNDATNYHIMPGVVATFYPGTAATPATIDVTPAVNDVRFTTTTGARFSEPWPLLPKVPILYFYAGVFFVAAPMSAGDKVILLGFDLDPTAHIQSGTVSDPADTRRHAGSYWCAIPGDITVPDAFEDGVAAAAGLVMGADGTPAQIRFSETGIQLGATATLALAFAPPVSTALTAIETYAATLTTAAAAIVAAPPATLPQVSAAILALATAMQSAGGTVATALSTAIPTIPTTVIKGL